MADLYSNDKPLPLCGRSLLKTTLADWKALGCTVNIGIELEAYVFQRGHDGKWEPYDTPGAYVYGTGPSVDPEGLMDIVWEAAEKLNFPIEAINSEFDWPQFEFTLEYADALTALDNLFLFRLMAKELLIKQGYLFSFMPKPLSDRGGSGMHLNISLSDEHGNNLLDDPSKDDGLSDMVKPMIAGLIKHHVSPGCPDVSHDQFIQATSTVKHLRTCGQLGLRPSLRYDAYTARPRQGNPHRASVGRLCSESLHRGSSSATGLSARLYETVPGSGSRAERRIHRTQNRQCHTGHDGRGATRSQG